MTLLDASGTGYLGLQKDAAWLAEVNKQLLRYGSNHPLSRLNAHRDFDVLRQVESLVARMVGCQAACLFSSGFLAGMAISRFFAEKAHTQGMFLALPSNHHPCLAAPVGWQITPTESVEENPKAQSSQSWIAFGQTIDPVYGCVDPSLEHPHFQNATWRVLDCSHSVGLWNHHALVDERAVLVGSLGKACAFPAGFVAGPQAAIEELKRSGSFCGAAPPSIAFSAAFLTFAKNHSQRREHLGWLLDLCDQQFNRHQNPDQRVPVYFLGQPGSLEKHACESAGFHLSWLRYPSPDSPLHLRLVVKADQTVDKLAACCDFLQQQGVMLQKPPQPLGDWRFYQAPLR